MADYRPKVPTDVKKALVDEAHGKCANPGCPNTLTEMHHIKEWCVYKVHDKDHMIAICPACHDSVTRGVLRIDDETLYRWKNINRDKKLSSAYLYLEPNEELPKIILGTISVQGATKFTVFELSENNDLEFCLKANTILLPRLRIGSKDKLLIDIVDGHVIRKDQQITLKYRPGKVRIIDKGLQERIPDWAMSIINNDNGLDLDTQPLLDLEAVEPGVLRVQGMWFRQELIIIVNMRQLSFIYPGLVRPLSFIGDGDGTKSVLMYTGSSVLFGIAEANNVRH